MLSARLPTHITIAAYQQHEGLRSLVTLVHFGSLPELFGGGFLLYTYRMLERHMGSAKFSSLLLFVTAVSCTAELALASR
jgi:hypothetical protein